MAPVQQIHIVGICNHERAGHSKKYSGEKRIKKSVGQPIIH